MNDIQKAQVDLGKMIAEKLRERNITKVIDEIEFIEKNLWIKDLRNNIVQFKLRDLQRQHFENKKRATEEAKREGKSAHFLLLKYRRGGFTTFEQAESYTSIRTKRHVDCVTLAQTRPDTKKIFKIAKRFYELDPDNPPLVSESQEEIAFSDTQSSFFIGTAGGKSFGRGQNLYRVHGSEVAFWDMNFDAIDDLVVGLIESARLGQVVLETTAAGCDNWFYHTYCEAMENRNNWTPLFYPWYIDPENELTITNPNQVEEVIETLDDEEAMMVNEFDLSIEQLLWRRYKQKELRTRFKQEYPANWIEAFRVSGSKFFDDTTLERAMAKRRDIIEKRDNDQVWVWYKPLRGRKYVMGADPAEGNEKGDNSVAVVLDFESGEQVAVFRGRCRPEIFAKKCVDLCKEYNNATFACEINNHGHSVMNTTQNVLRYKSLFFRPDHLKKSADGLAPLDKRPGWHTNVATRPLLLDELNDALEEGFIKINDPVFYAEAKVFVDNGGKFQAQAGKKDDTIMATGIAWQCRKQPPKGFISI